MCEMMHEAQSPHKTWGKSNFDMLSDKNICPHCHHSRCEWEQHEETSALMVDEWLVDDCGVSGDGPPPDVMCKYYYRAYILIKHSKLGAKKRIIIPNCILMGVHNYYPDPDGHYTGHNKK